MHTEVVVMSIGFQKGIDPYTFSHKTLRLGVSEEHAAQLIKLLDRSTERQEWMFWLVS